MKKITVLLLGILCLPFSWAMAHEFDVNLNQDSARFYYAQSLIGEGKGRADAEVGFLYTEDDFNLIHLGVHVMDQTGDRTRSLEMSIGGRIFLGTKDKVEIAALGLGGDIRLIPGAFYRRLAFIVDVHFAPNITAFADIKQYSEYGGRISYQILPRAHVYFGYRNVGVKINQGDDRIKLDEGGHIGLQIQF